MIAALQRIALRFWCAPLSVWLKSLKVVRHDH